MRAAYWMVVMGLALFSLTAKAKDTVFYVPPDAYKMPFSGDGSYCRRPDVVADMISEFSKIPQMKLAGVTALDFKNSTTVAIDSKKSTFACHGSFWISNGQEMPGTFMVKRNSADKAIWIWENDPDQQQVENATWANPNSENSQPDQFNSQAVPSVKKHDGTLADPIQIRISDFDLDKRDIPPDDEIQLSGYYWMDGYEEELAAGEPIISLNERQPRVGLLTDDASRNAREKMQRCRADYYGFCSITVVGHPVKCVHTIMGQPVKDDVCLSVDDLR